MYHHINGKERDLISLWRGQGISLREIARKLRRSTSSVEREIRRNSFRGKYYVAISAQARSEKRRRLANERHLLGNSRVEGYTLRKLGRGWSPEQIAGRLRKKYHRTVVSHEAIYQYVYREENRKLALWEYLRRGQKKRRHYHFGRRVHHSHIPLRISIRERPREIDKRNVFGHWEGDTMEGRAHDNGVHAEVERISGYLLAGRVDRMTSEITAGTQRDLFDGLPQRARISTTLDNGRENHLHFSLWELGMKTYFTDPYSSWQKGTVENTIGLLRNYLPKGTDLARLLEEELADIVDDLNDRPRKRLGYNTPREVFTKYLSVALQP